MALTDYYVTSGGVEPWVTNSIGAPSSLATAIANVVAGDRVNILDNATYTISSDTNFDTNGTATAPIWWRGYSSTEGDGNLGRDSAGLVVTTNLPLFNIDTFGAQVNGSGNFNIFDSLRITSGYTGCFELTGGSQTVRNCVATYTGTGDSQCVSVAGRFSSVVDCDVFCLATGTGNGLQIGVDCSVLGCRVHAAGTSGSGIGGSGFGNSIVDCTVYDCGDNGIEFTGGGGCRCCIVGNTIVNATNSGIEFANSLNDDLGCIAGNLITDCTYGIRSLYATTAQLCMVIGFNRFDRITTADIAGYDDWGQLPNETTSVPDPDDEYTDESTNDYSLLTSSPAVDAGPWNTTNHGSWQHGA